MTTTDESTTLPDWTNRIVRHALVDPRDLIANTHNPRVHSTLQLDALTASLDELGWLDEISVSERTGIITDGHARLALALKHDVALVPVKYLDLSPQDELRALLLKDAVTHAGRYDEALLDALIQEADLNSETLDRLLKETHTHLVHALIDAVPPAEFQQFDDALHTEYTCPKCAYSWSGQPR